MFNQLKSAEVRVLWGEENRERFIFETKDYGGNDYHYRNNSKEHLA